MSAVRIDAPAAPAAEQDLQQRAHTAALPIAQAAPRASAPSRAASMLDEFHTHPNALPETNHPSLRRTLLAEEHEELVEALELGEPAKIARELADVLYVVYGTAWVHGIDLDAALEEIHRAAMDKMRAGLRRDDGKIMKPPGFQPPDMTAATDGAAALVAKRRGRGADAKVIRRPAVTVDQVVDAIRAHHFRYADESQLQEGLAAALAAAGLRSRREVRLSARDRIDILVDAVGIEVKVDGRVSSLRRQITRYAESERVGAIVVVSNRVRHLHLPREINGKQVRSISLTGAGL